MDTLRESMGLLWRLGIGMIFITFIWFIITAMYPGISVKSFFAFISPKYSLTATTTKERHNDWLPAPKNYANLFSKNKATTTETSGGGVYVPGKPYDSTQNEYVNEYLNQSRGNTATYSYISYTDTSKVVYDGTSKYESAVFSSPDYTKSFQTTTTQPVVQPTVSQPIEPISPTVEEIRSLYIRNLSIYPKVMIGKNFTFTGEAREVMFSKSGSFPLVIIDNQGKVGVIGIAQATSDWAIPGWVRFKATINVTLPKNAVCTLIFESAQVQVSTGKPLRFPYNVTCNG